VPPAPPFDDSRRLTGSNLYFADAGAVLETVGVAIDDTLLDAWATRVRRMRAALGWPDAEIVARVHASGASLAFAAPIDQLLTATEVNEWAWLSALIEVQYHWTNAASPKETLLPPGSTTVVGPSEGAGRRMRENPHTVEYAQERGALPSPQPLSRRERGYEHSRRESERGYGHSREERGFKQKLPFDPETLSFVRELRQRATDAEQLIWFLLRNRRLFDHKFRRQHAVGPYVLDFYCHELKLAIELDGGQHNEPSERARDARRNAFIEEHGIHTLRFWNHDILQRTDDVLAEIWNACFNPFPPGRGVGVRERPLPDASLPHAPAHPACRDEDSALHTLRAFARAERNPVLVELVDAARARGLTVLRDDDTLSFGVGSGSRSWSLSALPSPAQIDWTALHNAPIALVTGSNGKTTTTRLLAACLRAHGWRTAYTCTDGVFVDGNALAAGDYSGPAGARTALRAPGVDAAVLETARGGLLRRGLAVQHADVAIVTNISDDHFGEYGVHDLDDLAAVKLTVARALGPCGTLVLNADDTLLVRHTANIEPRLAWFALDADTPVLQAHRAHGGATCGVRDGHLHLYRDGADHDLGAIAAMPLSFGGAARYNIANLAAAALAASEFGIAPSLLRDVLARFGAARSDNPGRLQHWSFGGIGAFVDYAHNPDGLRGLLDVATRTRTDRLALLLGQAGNREDAEIRELAAVAASFRPDLVVLKDLGGMLRGRAPGEVPMLLREELAQHGLHGDRIAVQLDEYEAVRAMLAWARAGDTLVLPVHDSQVKPQVAALLDALQAQDWRAGTPLPPT